MAKTNIETRVVIRNARLSFCRVLEPDDHDRYTTAIIIPKDNPAAAKIQAITDALIEEGKKDAHLFKGVPDKKILQPLHDGDEDRANDPAYKGCYYLNARSSTRPQIIDKYKARLTDPELLQEQVYSGVYCNISISLFTYNNQSIGVGAGLGNIMTLGYGDRLGGGQSADQDFADIQPEEEDDLGL